MKHLIYSLIALLGLIRSPATAQSRKATRPDPVAAFDAYVQQAVRDWQVPGLAVVVVKDGQTILKKGYGVRQLGQPDPVDARTLFACASTTKAMTAACMAMLVDEGKVHWDDPVVNYLPDFQLYDPFVTRDLRVRDLFLHNTGVGNTDFLWANSGLSPAEILHRMRLVKPSYSLRAGFIYQNVFYLTAGAVIEKVSGQPWATFIQKRLFDPLKMIRTRPTLAGLTDANRTSPHVRVDSTIMVVEHDTADVIGPAGSVWSCVDDLSRWTLFMLDSGKYDGGRLLKPATWTELFKPQTIVTEAGFYPTQQLTKPNWKTYGLGWFQHDYRGHKVNFHTGSLTGAVALHAQLPDEHLAIFILGNLDHAELRHALMYRAFDQFALGTGRDWSMEFRQLYAGLAKQGEGREKMMLAKHTPNTKSSLPLTAYAGHYEDPLYGKIDVRLTDGKLRMVADGRTTATLEHWQYDTFQVVFDKKWYGKALLLFQLTPMGTVGSLNADGAEFRRAGE